MPNMDLYIHTYIYIYIYLIYIYIYIYIQKGITEFERHSHVSIPADLSKDSSCAGLGKDSRTAWHFDDPRPSLWYLAAFSMGSREVEVIAFATPTKWNPLVECSLLGMKWIKWLQQGLWHVVQLSVCFLVRCWYINNYRYMIYCLDKTKTK